jgi:hypothetical protein
MAIKADLKPFNGLQNPSTWFKNQEKWLGHGFGQGEARKVQAGLQKSPEHCFGCKE